jgi:hypothetical protein
VGLPVDETEVIIHNWHRLTVGKIHEISWYLGLYSQFSNIQMLVDNAKRTFHRSLYAIFGKVGGVASEEVTVHLIASKCLLVLWYAFEGCQLTKSTLCCGFCVQPILNVSV